jgi:hypothetical protein
MTTAPQRSPARLVIHRGAGRTTISAVPDLDRLADVAFTGRRPEVDITSDIVRISYPLLGFPSLRARGADIFLHAVRAWSVEIDGGAGEVDADLSATTVRSIQIAGGVARSTLVLPPVVGVVPVVISGGVSRVAVRLPEGTAFDLDIRGGVRDLSLDEQYVGAVGGRFWIRSSGLRDRNRHYRITIGGGASRLTVTADAPGPARATA